MPFSLPSNWAFSQVNEEKRNRGLLKWNPCSSESLREINGGLSSPFTRLASLVPAGGPGRGSDPTCQKRSRCEGSCPRSYTCRKWSGTVPLSIPAERTDRRGSMDSCSQSSTAGACVAPEMLRGGGEGPHHPSLSSTQATPLVREVLRGTRVHRGFTPLKTRCALRSGEHRVPREGQQPLPLWLWGSVDGKTECVFTAPRRWMAAQGPLQKRGSWKLTGVP